MRPPPLVPRLGRPTTVRHRVAAAICPPIQSLRDGRITGLNGAAWHSVLLLLVPTPARTASTQSPCRARVPPASRPSRHRRGLSPLPEQQADHPSLEEPHGRQRTDRWRQVRCSRRACRADGLPTAPPLLPLPEQQADHPPLEAPHGRQRTDHGRQVRCSRRACCAHGLPTTPPRQLPAPRPAGRLTLWHRAATRGSARPARAAAPPRLPAQRPARTCRRDFWSVARPAPQTRGDEDLAPPAAVACPTRPILRSHRAALPAQRPAGACHPVSRPTILVPAPTVTASTWRPYRTYALTTTLPCRSTAPRPA